MRRLAPVVALTAALALALTLAPTAIAAPADRGEPVSFSWTRLVDWLLSALPASPPAPPSQPATPPSITSSNTDEGPNMDPDN
jgi:hypothetical protein